MEEITTIGVDIAKNVFQLHGVNAAGQVVLCKALRRGQMQPFFEKLSPCLIGVQSTIPAKRGSRAARKSDTYLNCNDGVSGSIPFKASELNDVILFYRRTPSLLES